MAEFTFSQNRVKRMRLVNYRTGDGLEFSFNPKEVSEDFVANISVDDTPGQSDGIVRFASGKAKEIKFTLKLSGERRIRMFGDRFGNEADPILIPEGSYSVRGEIAFITQFVFPTDPEDGGDGASDLVVFTAGPQWPGVLCAMKSSPLKAQEFDEDLDVTDAEIDIVLIRKVDRNRFSNTIWRGNR